MTWLPGGRLQCDEHRDQIFDHPGSRAVVTAAARRKGWLIHDWQTLGGKPLQAHLCVAKCVPARSLAAKAEAERAKAKALEGDVPLFDFE